MRAMHNFLPKFGKKYRNSFDIIASLLEVASSGASRFVIARRLNTNYSHLSNYLNFLIKAGFLEVKFCGNRFLYETSEKGFEFLRLYNVLLGLLSSETDTPLEVCQNVHESIGKKS